MKYRDLTKLIEADGWRLKRTIGSHLQYQHRIKIGTVTISAGGKMNHDIPRGTMLSVLKQAGLK